MGSNGERIDNEELKKTETLWSEEGCDDSIGRAFQLRGNEK